MTYDDWKTTNPDDEFLGDAPQSSEDQLFAEHGKPETRYWAKPIPFRQYDWEATWPDYEGGDPVGFGLTEQDAIADLIAETEFTAS